MLFCVSCQNDTQPSDEQLSTLPPTDPLEETDQSFHQRMQWWKEARFGLFIHWGLYALPAGKWGDKKSYGEWIRTNAQIPLETYDQFAQQFNPVKFDAAQWVRLAKAAGMKYIVITSKHHDGFALFDSDVGDFDVMNTPFQRDILKELAEACRDEGIRLCFYHSIMDWHHPDYLPRRPWETDRTIEGADMERYIAYMKAQVKELLTNYGEIGVMWFDGEWEETWNHDRGVDLYRFVRRLQPNTIVNNRVDVGREGMKGDTRKGFVGDFGTPEQQIPDTGIPGKYWETCMTMNDHWGYNRYNDNWKSRKDLIRKLTDIASKGGNFLLNIGPTAEGSFPPESIDRLQAFGRWMDVYGESIYGTSASPVSSPDWGRLTFVPDGEQSILYAHVFDWPEGGGELELNGLATDPSKVYWLADPQQRVAVSRRKGQLYLTLSGNAPDTINTVLKFEFETTPEFFNPPAIEAITPVFLNELSVALTADHKADIHYTLDGSEPDLQSPIYKEPLTLNNTTTVRAIIARDGQLITAISERQFDKLAPLPARHFAKAPEPGWRYRYYEGDWEVIPDFSALQPVAEGRVDTITVSVKKRDERFGLQFEGFVEIEEEALYAFTTESDDGSRLYIDDKMVVDNDGLHGPREKEGLVALAAGWHQVRVDYFEKTGGDMVVVRMGRPGEVGYGGL